MKLTLEQIRSIALGVVRADENNDSIRLYRFTEEQESIYRQANVDFWKKTFASAGIKLQFQTDSKTLLLKVNITPGSSR